MFDHKRNIFYLFTFVSLNEIKDLCGNILSLNSVKKVDTSKHFN